MGLGTLLLPISAVTLLMVLARSHGTASAEPLGFLTIVCGPPAIVATGIGLLLRKRWAWFSLLALLAGVLAWQGREIARSNQPQTSYVSASGVPTTVLATPRLYSLPIIGGSLALLAVMFTRRVRAEFSPAARPARPAPASAPFTAEVPAEHERDWRVGHRGRDAMYYEEQRGGTWQRIEIDGEMLTGRAHHVIYFAPPERWASYPEWARHRREEIITRIKSEFREPDYEYQEPPAPLPPLASPPQPGSQPQEKGARAAALALVALFAFTGWMFWIAKAGLDTGEIRLPAKHSATRDPISRQEEPALFWISLATYSAVGAGTCWLAVWIIAVGRKR